MPHIVSIAYTPDGIERRPTDHYARVVTEKATLVADRGIQGDAKSQGGRRQLNLMLAETVEGLRTEGFHTHPGELGEQIVVAGLEAGSLAPGTRLRLGDLAVIEVTLPRAPCARFAHIQGKPKETAEGRIGVMARVVHGGEIAVGDDVTVLTATEPTGERNCSVIA